MMLVEDNPILDAGATIAFILLLIGMIIAFVRLAKGPSLPDRVVALDLLAVQTVGFLGIFAISTGEAAFIDVAISLALVMFLGTIAFARYVERRQPRIDPDKPPEPGTITVSEYERRHAAETFGKDPTASQSETSRRNGGA